MSSDDTKWVELFNSHIVASWKYFGLNVIFKLLARLDFIYELSNYLGRVLICNFHICKDESTDVTKYVNRFEL